LYSAAKRQFGSWHAALTVAGFTPARRRWSKEAILAEIRDHFQQGRSLSSGAPANKCLALAAIRRFGNWHKALRAAGVSQDKAKRTRPKT